MVDYYRLPIGENYPEKVSVVVEIPKNTRNKIEYDPEHCIFRMDRVLYSPLRYPGDYGFIPQTLAPDGDALDILVLVTDPTYMGCVLSTRPVALLEMKDEGEVDTKILAVPDKDPRFSEVEDLSTVPKHIIKEVEHFFGIYKELEGKKTTLFGWKDIQAAFEAIEDTHQVFKDTKM